MVFTNTQDVLWSSPQGQAGYTPITLAAHADALAFAGRYDQYRINWARVTFRPQSDRMGLYQEIGTGAGTFVNSEVPSWGCYVDQDDETTLPSGINSVIGHGGRWKPWPGVVSKRWVPKPLGMLYKSSTTTGYQLIPKSCWIDCNDSSVPHYGLKWYFSFPHRTAMTQNSPYPLRYFSEITLNISFKNPLPTAAVGNF